MTTMVESSSTLINKVRRGKLRHNKTAKMHDRHFVQHNYHDHANDRDNVGPLTQQPRQRGGVTLPFPLKLHQALEQVEDDGFADCISWQPHGRCFVIRKPKQFVEQVMPRYFNQTKLTSFQRQLNLYGFVRLTRGPDANGYYHEYFLRGRPFLTKYMVRTRVKGTKIKGASSPDDEPDFYSMPPVGPYDPTTMASPCSVVSNDDGTEDSNYMENCVHKEDEEGEEEEEEQPEQFVSMPPPPIPSALPCPPGKLGLQHHHHMPRGLPSLFSGHRKGSDTVHHFPIGSSSNMPRQVSEFSWVSSSSDEEEQPQPSEAEHHHHPHLLDPVDAMIMELHQDQQSQHDDPLLSLGILLDHPTSSSATNQEDLPMLYQNDVALGRKLEQILEETTPW